jgi:hypothetical protein
VSGGVRVVVELDVQIGRFDLDVAKPDDLVNAQTWFDLKLKVSKRRHGELVNDLGPVKDCRVGCRWPAEVVNVIGVDAAGNQIGNDLGGRAGKDGLSDQAAAMLISIGGMFGRTALPKHLKGCTDDLVKCDRCRERRDGVLDVAERKRGSSGSGSYGMCKAGGSGKGVVESAQFEGCLYSAL